MIGSAVGVILTWGQQLRHDRGGGAMPQSKWIACNTTAAHSWMYKCMVASVWIACTQLDVQVYGWMYKCVITIQPSLCPHVPTVPTVPTVPRSAHSARSDPCPWRPWWPGGNPRGCRGRLEQGSNFVRNQARGRFDLWSHAGSRGLDGDGDGIGGLGLGMGMGLGA